MDVPDLVTDALDGQSVLASVGIGGDDGVFVTPGRTLVYRGDGLLSDESVGTYDHGFDRLELSEGRRRSSFTLHYYDREESFAVGSGHTQEVLRTVLAAHLRATDALAADEQVRGVFHFNELTLVVGTERLLKHVGGAVWSADYEAHPYADLTRLAFEEGDHAMQVIIAIEGRPERIKLPNDRAAEVRHTVEAVVLDFHGADSVDALNETLAPEEEPEEAAEPDYADSGIDSLIDDGSGGDGSADDAFEAQASTEPADHGEAGGRDATTDSSGAEGGFVAAGDREILARLDELEATVEAQTERIERQQETIEQLVEELRRGR